MSASEVSRSFWWMKKMVAAKTTITARQTGMSIFQRIFRLFSM